MVDQVKSWLSSRRALVLGTLGLVVAVVGLLVLAVVLPPHLIDTGSMSAADRLQAENDLRTTLLQAVGGAVLLTGVAFTALTLRLNKQGQITDRFTKAIDQLGDPEKLHVRVGGIYALERIARDSPDDHQTIMEVLTSFLREASPRMGPDSRSAEAPAEEQKRERLPGCPLIDRRRPR